MSCIFLLASNFYFSYLSLKTYSLSGFDSYILCLVSNDRSQAGNTKSGIFLEPQESLEASFYFLCCFFFFFTKFKVYGSKLQLHTYSGHFIRFDQRNKHCQTYLLYMCPDKLITSCIINLVVSLQSTSLHQD